MSINIIKEKVKEESQNTNKILTEGIYLFYRGKEHLVYRMNLVKPTGFPALFSPITDLWNFNAHHNSSQWQNALREAKRLNLEGEPVNIIEGYYSSSGCSRPSYCKSSLSDKLIMFDYLRSRQVDSNAPLSPLTKNMFMYDSARCPENLVLYNLLAEIADINLESPADFPTSSELQSKGFIFERSVNNIAHLSNALLELEKAGKVVAPAKDEFLDKYPQYKGAVSIYVKK